MLRACKSTCYFLGQPISAYLKPAGCRLFTMQDASAALRPFYFIVHPDLFGQYPAERAVNENSLKLLNEFLAQQQNFSRSTTKEVKFFIRGQNNARQELKQVKIKLKTKNLRDTVIAILAACGLSDDHVRDTTNLYGINRPIEWHPSYYTATGKKNPNPPPNEQRSSVKPVALTLRTWLAMNMSKSRKHEESVRHIQDDITRLQQKIRTELKVEDVRFDSVWGMQHFRGCLMAFCRLYGSHPDFLKHVLNGRVLVFSNSTGVSRLGEIVLSSEDVPQKWMMLLQTVHAYDAVLSRLPVMEEKLSELLNNIQVVRREKSHYSVMAEQYELMLDRLLNSLRRCQDYKTATFQEKDLSHLQLVVAGECNPLMLTSLGEFLIPASVPGTIVVDFIRDNSKKAVEILRDIDRFLQQEEECRQTAISVLQVSELVKDETVTSAQMISCCTRLAAEHWRVKVSLEGSRIRVSHYYSVMQDGLVCIPWDWIGDDD